MEKVIIGKIPYNKEFKVEGIVFRTSIEHLEKGKVKEFVEENIESFKLEK